MKCRNSVSVYIDGLWSCANCGSIACVDEANELETLFGAGPFLRDKKEDSKKCECGSDRTYGPNSNTHAIWCPKYVK